MLFNKMKYMKKGCKKLLRKVGKRWIVLSVALLGLLGGSVAVTQEPTNADATTPVEQQASNLHGQLLNNTVNSNNNANNTNNNNNDNNNWQYSDETAVQNYSDNNGAVSDNGYLNQNSDSSNQNNSDNHQYYFNSDVQGNNKNSDYGLTVNGNNVNYSDNDGNLKYTSTNPSDNTGVTSSDNGQNVYDQITSDINNAMNSDFDNWDNWSDVFNSDDQNNNSVQNSDNSISDNNFSDGMNSFDNNDFFPFNWSDEFTNDFNQFTDDMNNAFSDMDNAISDAMQSDANFSDQFPSDNYASDVLPSDSTDTNNSDASSSDTNSDVVPQSDNNSDNNTNSDASAQASDVQQMKAQTLTDINNDRAANGLSPVTEDSNLDQLADLRAQQLESNYSHYNSDGQSYMTQDANQLGVNLDTNWSENIAEASLGEDNMGGDPKVYNNQNGNDMANMDEDAMMNYDQAENDGHRKNILDPNLTKVGIGVTYDGSGTFYLAEDFSN